MGCGVGKRWWGETLEAATGDFFCAGRSLPAARGRDGPPKLAGVRGIADLKRGEFLHLFAAVWCHMVAGIDANNHLNGGARRLTAVAHYRAVDGEEESLLEACTHHGARGGVYEGARGPTAPSRMKNTAAGGGEEVGGELDFGLPMPIPSDRTEGAMRQRRGSAHTGSRGSRGADPWRARAAAWWLYRA
jgi:hypothetical protein